ncbi:DUF6266 family protein [Pedobacter boryungensis]|uniref:Uncharacterized protein n=1 Tax=Pedobacter boryungensis TaxID=869962 RepID=A0ABX2DA81_9SPHI|nr:DUF6266 family protein [Pedobacter boryungensis]NQX30489.1 hypothetical protein [Pedobacter boryungensis]
MARLINGILGGFSGKVGTVVGVIRDGDCLIRSVPKKRTHFTSNELINQQKMAMVQAYLKPLKDLVQVGFANYYTKTGGFRAALAHTRREALAIDADGNFHIDPALFKISGGTLPQAINPAVVCSGLEMRITWDITDVGYEHESDQLMVLVYDPLKGNTIKRIFNGAFRRDGELKLQLDSDFSSVAVHVYIGFVAADRSSQSDSQYLGKVIVV